MPDLTILTITSDSKFLSVLRRRIHDQVTGGSRMIVAPTVDEACSLLTTVRPRLIVVHWTRDCGRYEQLDRLLWTTTVQARTVPVLVITERYRTDQATMMFRMGVVDYISRTHHLDRLGSVLSAYVPPTAVEDISALAPDESGHAAKAWMLSHEPAPVASRAV